MNKTHEIKNLRNLISGKKEYLVFLKRTISHDKAVLKQLLTFEKKQQDIIKTLEDKLKERISKR